MSALRPHPLAALAAAALVVFAAPAVADARGSVQVLKVPLQAASAPSARAANATTGKRWTTLKSIRVRGGYSLAGLQWRGSRHTGLQVRSATLHGAFGPWQTLELSDLGRRPGKAWTSEPAWLGRSARLQVRVLGRLRDLRAVVVKPGPDPVLRAVPRANAAQPAIQPRSAWGADEKLRKGQPAIAPRISAVILHHTATPNGYAAAQVPSLIRSLYLYQTRGNGLSDLGYNYLVDAQGRVWEGRFGGIDKNVVGSHTPGFNGGTVGVALIGNFSSTAPPAKELQALERLLAWRLDIAHVDPSSRATLTSEGNDRYAKGRSVQFPAIFAHRDAGPADCPGDALYAKLAAIRAAVDGQGDLKVFDPSLTPPTIAAAFRPIRFRARLSSSAAWRVTVLTTAGAVVARYTGNGSAVDATWDGSVIGGGALPRADLLRWRIEAGSARSAVGAFDGTVASGGGATPGAPVTATADRIAAAPAALVAGAAGQLTWRQLKPATVKVSVTTLAGVEIVVLRPAAPLAAGTQALAWNGRRAGGVALFSGHYRYVIQSQEAGQPLETLTANVDVRRQAAGFAATAGLSPNGDGVSDVAAFSFMRYEPGDAQLRLLKGETVVKNLALLYEQAAGPFQYLWTGRGVPDGSYAVQLLVPGLGGAVEFRMPVRVDTHAPGIRVRGVKKINRLRDVVATVTMSEAARIEVRRGGKVLLTRNVVRGQVKLRLSRRAMGSARTLTIVGRDPLGNATAKPVRLTIPR